MAEKKELNPDQQIKDLKAMVEESEAFNIRQRVLSREFAAGASDLIEESRRDKLMGFLTREAFLEEVAGYFEREKIKGEQGIMHGAILFLDVDKFKDFNTKYGEPGGDRALQEVAKTLPSILHSKIRNELNNERRKNSPGVPDIFCKWGGEEIVVFLPGAKAQETLKSLMQQERIPKLGEIKVKMSVKESPEPMEETLTFSGVLADYVPGNLQGLEKELDAKVGEVSKMLPQAKAEGRNRILLYNEI